MSNPEREPQHMKLPEELETGQRYTLAENLNVGIASVRHGLEFEIGMVSELDRSFSIHLDAGVSLTIHEESRDDVLVEPY